MGSKHACVKCAGLMVWDAPDSIKCMNCGRYEFAPIEETPERTGGGLVFDEDFNRCGRCGKPVEGMKTCQSCREKTAQNRRDRVAREKEEIYGKPPSKLNHEMELREAAAQRDAVDIRKKPLTVAICLTCDLEFMTPDKTLIRTCNKCKRQHQTVGGAGNRLKKSELPSHVARCANG